MAPRHTVLLLTVMVCLLMHTSFAEIKKPEVDPPNSEFFGGLKVILSGILNNVLKNISSQEASFLPAGGSLNTYLKDVEKLRLKAHRYYLQSKKNERRINDIYMWAKTLGDALNKHKKSLAQYFRDLNVELQTGKETMDKLHHQKMVVDGVKIDVENAVDDFKKKQDDFLNVVLPLVVNWKVPSLDTAISLISDTTYIIVSMYSSYQIVMGGINVSNEVLNESQRLAETVKLSLQNSEFIEAELKRNVGGTYMKHTRFTDKDSGSMKYTSFSTSLLQSAFVFGVLTLIIACAEKS